MYGVSLDKCKAWLRSEHPDEFACIYPDEAASLMASLQSESSANKPSEDAKDTTIADHSESNETAGQDAQDPDKRHQTRGGVGMLRDATTKLDKLALKRASAKVQIRRQARTKRKTITTVRGLEVFGVDLKKMAKSWAGAFACGVSVGEAVGAVAGTEEIIVQGDFVEEIRERLLKAIPEVRMAMQCMFLAQGEANRGR